MLVECSEECFPLASTSNLHRPSHTLRVAGAHLFKPSLQRRAPGRGLLSAGIARGTGDGGARAGCG